MEPPIPLDNLMQVESAWVEWKKTGDPLEIVAKLVAYANDATERGDGGWVVCGVEETRDEQGMVRPNLVGLTQGELNGVKNRVLEACARYVSPPLNPAVYQTNVPADPSRFILFFHVQVSGVVHTHDTKQGSKVWVLRDSQTHEAKGEQLRNLYLRRGLLPPFLDQLAYDRYLGRYASLDDLDMIVAHEYRRQANLPQPMAEYFKPNVQIEAGVPPLCVEQEIATGKKAIVPTNLAILLFGHTPVRFIQGAYADVVVFPGTDIIGPLSFRIEPTGPLIVIIRDVIRTLESNMGILMDKSRSAFEIRQNRPRYSATAVQEALMNAFAHRDYEDPQPVRILVFADRIEIASPGGVTPRVEVAKVQAGEFVGARWRNPSLARYLARMKYGVQAVGQGIPTIFRETLETAEYPPRYEIDGGQVRVILPAYQPPPVSPRAPPSPRPSPSPTGKAALLLVSIGSGSIRAAVEPSRKRLGLDEAEVVMDFALPAFIDPTEEAWEMHAKKIRNEVSAIANDPAIGPLHLFYRGPVVLAPLFGALVANAKPLVVYYYEEGEYKPAYTITTKFLKSRD